MAANLPCRFPGIAAAVPGRPRRSSVPTTLITAGRPGHPLTCAPAGAACVDVRLGDRRFELQGRDRQATTSFSGARVVGAAHSDLISFCQAFPAADALLCPRDEIGAGQSRPHCATSHEGRPGGVGPRGFSGLRPQFLQVTMSAYGAPRVRLRCADCRQSYVPFGGG
jgi:hypothetical protein